MLVFFYIFKLKYALEMLEKFTSTDSMDNGPVYRRINNIKIFNKLMFTLGKHSRVNDIVWCFDRMKQIGIDPDLDSYVAALIAFGSSKVKNNNAIIRILIDCQKANVIYFKYISNVFCFQV